MVAIEIPTRELGAMERQEGRVQVRMRLSRMLCSLVVALAICFAFGTSVSGAAESGIGFLLDGKVLTWDSVEYGAIEVTNGRTLIPLRIVSNQLGYEVEWDGSSKSAVVKNGQRIYRFPIGKSEIHTPNGIVKMDVPNTAINGRTYLPVRAFFEALGLKVDWKARDDVQKMYGLQKSALADRNYVVVTTTSSKGVTSDEKAKVSTISKTAASSFNVTVFASASRQLSERETEMMDQLAQLKLEYPDGMSWTNENRLYDWGDTLEGCDCYTGKGCVAFALEISDKLFARDAKARKMDPELIEATIQVGDIIRVDGGCHSVVVIDRDEEGITVAEGNYNSAVHWGRRILYKKLREEATYFITRY